MSLSSLLLWGIGGGIALSLYSSVFLILSFISTRDIPIPSHYSKTSFFVHLLVISLEEFFFRLVPFYALVILGADQNQFILISVILISSFIFGQLHIPECKLDLLEISFGGVLLFIIYLKSGFISAIFAHLIRNYLFSYSYNSLIYNRLVIHEVNRRSNL